MLMSVREREVYPLFTSIIVFRGNRAAEASVMFAPLLWFRMRRRVCHVRPPIMVPHARASDQLAAGQRGRAVGRRVAGARLNGRDETLNVDLCC